MVVFNDVTDHMFDLLNQPSNECGQEIGSAVHLSVYRIVDCVFFSSRRRHTRCSRDWSSDVCSSDLEAWQFPRLETFLQDIRYGLRGIRKAPSFSLVVIFTLALGIGANTAIFSVVYSVLLRPLPYPHGERLVRLGESTSQVSGIAVTWVNFQHWRAGNITVWKIEGVTGAGRDLMGRGGGVPPNTRLV